MDEQEVLDLIPKVIELAKKQKAEGSTITVSLLQRRLRIGYILGAMCMDKMEELGWPCGTVQWGARTGDIPLSGD